MYSSSPDSGQIGGEVTLDLQPIVMLTQDTETFYDRVIYFFLSGFTGLKHYKLKHFLRTHNFGLKHCLNTTVG